jgi:4-amino-4-deoxy-L-arabinose transferase-like glycosyltransferase
MLKILTKNPTLLYTSGIILLLLALLINLGRVNIFLGVDEATRALVALEMMISDNFVTPTLNGDFYYNKPPLFNWILAGFFSLFGTSEFVMRLPTVISFLGFAYTIYFFVSKELGKKAGIITAFAFVSLGRLLFWETFFAYIDTTFSWAVYTGLMFMFYFYKRNKPWQLFIVSYLFMAIAFMLKGLPAIVFQGITLLTLFISEKKFKQLFSIPHVAGGLVFIFLVGGYYLIYHQYNSLENVFATLWGETTQRTVINQGWWSTVKHLFVFPYEMTYHYLPWTLLIVFTFVNGFWKTTLQNKFLIFNLMVFLFNIIPYWTSPDVYPKYIMMLMPMLLAVYVFYFLKNSEANGKLSKIIEIVFISISAILTIAWFSLLFIGIFDGVKFIILKVFLLAILSGIFTWLMIKIKSQRLVIFAIIIIIARIGFDWFIWPPRASQFEVHESNALKVAEITGRESVFYYQAPMLQYGASFYMSKAKNRIINTETFKPMPNTFYIVDNGGLERLQEKHKSVKIYFQYPNVEDGRNLVLIKILE